MSFLNLPNFYLISIVAKPGTLGYVMTQKDHAILSLYCFVPIFLMPLPSPAKGKSEVWEIWEGGVMRSAT